MSTQKKEKKPERDYYTGLGICVGLSLGVAYGQLTHNLALGIAIGLCLGVGVGSLLDARKRKKRQEEWDAENREQEQKNDQ